MTVKQSYNIGDTVWIYGVGSNTRPTKGTVVKSFTIDYEGFNKEPHYVIAIPTHIEYLMEVRTWHTMSQDENGPVGSLREIGSLSATNKLAARTGYIYDPNSHYVDDSPSTDEINAALAKSIDSHSHQPLIIKEPKAVPRRKFARKKSKE
jgi:hypothetical protein